MRRTATLGVAALVVLAALTAPAVSDEAHFGVTNVEVVPATPAPGETGTITVTVENFPHSPSTIEITDVAVRTRGEREFKEFSRVENVGTITAGGKLTVPVPFTFDKAGTRTLTVRVVARLPDGSVETVSYPVVVRVRNEHPSLAVQSVDAVASATGALNLSLSNGLDTAVRNVVVELSGDDVTGAHTAHRARIPAGETTTLSFDVKPANPGQRTVTATITYTTAGGVQRTATRELHYDAARLDTAVSLDATRIDGGNAVRATVSNLGNVPAENLVVAGTIDDRVVERVAVGTLEPGKTRTVVLNATGITGRADLRVDATYESAGERRSKTQTVSVAGNPATIKLTGLDVERENGNLHVTGSASNVGLDSASSVVVRVLNSEHVTPAYPGRNYFVGTVPPSDFVSFDVYASATANATTIPLEVTYLRDGIEHRTVVKIPIEGQAGPTQPPQSGGAPGSGLLPYGIAAVVLLGVVALVVVAWRNYRGRT